ncbi:phosphoglucosamine mutase [Tamlana sp. 2201CG12-4]|uniref:phosphoglucosamine mutase n=1 Tax=Tamlana sp. 2201CG12-4 TaxID=3112582 RepID=UPI002DBEC79B|nr:phosphoglucosamine mutase [Tamlana sp. 2201CG12-4]MEC3905522.1 phosphoglucosamine mutase [Tamlana sp. 2201CG12-4]
MTLIKSISGIRGTIGGSINDNLTPVDVVKFTAAYGAWLKRQNLNKPLTVIVGRDARISGDMVSGLVCNTLIGLGIHVKNIGLSTTPTVEVSVPMESADGGIIITASHNPKQWNALKLLNNKGEFIDGNDGLEVLSIAESNNYDFSGVDFLGHYKEVEGYIDQHIDEVLKLELVDVEAIQNAGFKIVVDAVNSTGGIAVPALLEKLGVECVKLYCEPNGHFPHNPEPLKEHLSDLSELVVKTKADLGIVVDPDVDRLAFVCEDGTLFGEDYTLVACADYVLGKMKGGHTVSNLSSSRALKDVAESHGGTYSASAVGEVNVVIEMKRANASIGGEGNGGVIYPASHYGRDSLVGIALFLSHLAHKKISCKELRASYPSYFMSKNKIQLTPEIDVDAILKKMAHKYQHEELNRVDGVKVDFKSEWVHLRKSNTEPIVRIYTESTTQGKADDLAKRILLEIKEIAGL